MFGTEVYSPKQCKEALSQIKANVPGFIERCKQNPDIKMYEVYRGLKAWNIQVESGRS
jgi:hypothetical protein